TSFLPVASFFWATGRRLVTASLGAMLYAPTRLIDEMVAHAYDGLPNEACGLIVGHAAENRAVRFEPTTNVAASSKIYTIDGLEQLKIERAAEAEGLAVIGVMHSRSEEHTSELQSRENLVCRLLLEKK